MTDDATPPTTDGKPDGEQAKVTSWNSNTEDTETTSGTSESAGTEKPKPSTSVRDDQQDSVEEIDWGRRELGDSYPVDMRYHCDVSGDDHHFDTLRDLKTHVKENESISWPEFLKQSNLHRCAGCGKSLSTLEEIYCDDCQTNPNNRIPCRNCGTVRVKVSDPFCSAECAGERIEATTGPPAPLESPDNPSDSWLDHPHRLPTGIPTAAPFIENHRLACRECYEYGGDSLHEFAVHVAEKHPDLGWSGYIEKYGLRCCRVCDDPLDSLLPLYCSDSCQFLDPDPIKMCENKECGKPVERGQKYCKKDCYHDYLNER